ncbi:MAG: MOSC domain-containing protein [Longimicrobiales bacterium]
MVNVGRLEAIWIKRAHRGPMDPAREAVLVAGSGIVGNADQGRRRQVTVLSREDWAEHTAGLGDPDPGQRRANLLVSGVRLTGTRGRTLRIGEVRIRIEGETRPCERMDEATPGLREALSSPWGGGAFGVVLDDGVIRLDDEVVLEAP